MGNINNPDFNLLLNEIHENIEKRFGNEEEKNDIRTENRVVEILCRNGDYGMEPVRCAKIMNAKHGTDMRGNDIISVFNKLNLGNPSERREVFPWAEKLADCFVSAMKGSKDAYNEFLALFKVYSVHDKKWKSRVRIAGIMMYVRHVEIDPTNDFKTIRKLGSTKAKFCFYDMIDIVESYYGYPSSKPEKQKKKSEPKLTHEQALKKIEKLEGSLDRTNAMLGELQAEFNEQLEESKIKEMIDFFAMLNSEKYGYILDELLNAKMGMNILSKKNYELPIEINGVRILVNKLIQFIRDNHIEPIMKLHSLKEVSADEIASCNYEGTPFMTRNQKKTVRVVSPGWIYKDKEIQISRPTVKEE